MAKRASAGAKRSPGLCGGCAVGRKKTRSRPRARRAARTGATCPTWMGSKLPPKRPTFTASAPVLMEERHRRHRLRELHVQCLPELGEVGAGGGADLEVWQPAPDGAGAEAL